LESKEIVSMLQMMVNSKACKFFNHHLLMIALQIFWIFLCSQNDDHPQEDLAKFGYKHKYDFLFKHIFWLNTRIYNKNMGLSPPKTFFAPNLTLFSLVLKKGNIIFCSKFLKLLIGPPFVFHDATFPLYIFLACILHSNK
jgi:hypothetical protein